MKKLMMAAAVFCAAVAAQAATWTVINAGAYDGYMITLPNASDMNTSFDTAGMLSEINALFCDEAGWESTKATTWAEHYTVLSGLFAPTTIASGTAQGEDTYFSTLKSVQFLLCPDGIAPGKDYVWMKTMYDESGNSASTFDFTNAEVFSSGTFRTDGIPEPTSGILLLLGVAGLALKRKQK